MPERNQKVIIDDYVFPNTVTVTLSNDDSRDYVSKELYESIRAANDVWQTENAKLFDLCKAWRKFAYEIFDECFGEPEASDDFMALEQRMRELEVEVN